MRKIESQFARFDAITDFVQHQIGETGVILGKIVVGGVGQRVDVLRAAGRVAALDLGSLYQALAAQNVQMMTNGNGCEIELSAEFFDGGGAAFFEDMPLMVSMITSRSASSALASGPDAARNRRSISTWMKLSGST